MMEQLESKLCSNLSLQFAPEVPLFFLCIMSLRYKWMTYGEAGTARSAIGSGLIYHGIPKARSFNENLFFQDFNEHQS